MTARHTVTAMSEPSADTDLTERARATWEAVAPGWEAARARVFEAFRPVSEWLVERVAPQPGQTVLELAAGPGETGFLAAERLGPSGTLLSTDISASMVEAARRGAAARGLTQVECRVMDAQAIDLPDDGVDGVLSRLGFMLMPDPDRAVAEVRRVLRPGGRLAYAVIGTPPANQWMSLIAMSLMQRGHVLGGDPFGPGGPFSLADPERNRAMLTGAGFAEVEVTELTGTMAFDSVEDHFELQSRVGGPVATLIASLSASEAAAVRAALGEAMAPFAAGDGYALPWSLVAASAR